MTRGWPYMIAAGGTALLVIGILLWAHYAQAHDHGRPEMDDWLAGLHSKNKTWCCKGDDTDTIEDWETKGDRYRVKFRGEWFDVPEDALVEGPNKGGDALLWMNKGYLGMSVRCFLPGSMT